jgi:hypothetical protein
LKTQEAVCEKIGRPITIKPNLESFETLVDVCNDTAEQPAAQYNFIREEVV